jgi:tetratricopeptide (TPR) repeat protein
MPTDDDPEGATKRERTPRAGTDVTRREGTPRAGTDVTHREGTPRASDLPLPAATASDFADDPKPEYLSRGTLVSRYVIVDVLGDGGMGVVYGAFDPELDRKIAIKLLQTHSSGSSSGEKEKAWIQREAQALARLSHPNVVAVHDVGTLPGGRVFVAMELVEGDTLRAWLKERERSWREVVAVMLAAGTGLAAAHRAGLIHRDFKPDNVIVGKDGRARVMDFGLARLRADDELGAPARRKSDLKLEARSPLSERLTMVGVVVGTPAYMAPEIYEGQVADARTDQFAFGVTLYEALYRTRPYDKTDRTSAPVAKAPPDIGVPARIQRVVMRAIAIDREQRFASMDELLAELSIDPARGRKRALAAAGVALLAAGVGGGVYMMKAKPTELCVGAERRLAGVWDATTKAAVKTAYLATKQPFAAQAYAGLEKALDHYAAEWTTTLTESCEATRVRGEQSETVQALRQACLDQDLEVLRELVHLEASADTGLVQKGDKAAFELDPIAHCSNIAALTNPGRPPDAIVARVVELSKQVAAAKADVIAGKYMPALMSAKAAVDGARQVGWDPLLAEALATNAGALLATGNHTDAAPLLEEAIKAAVRGKRDDLAAGAAMANAMVAAEAGNAEKARMWLDIGEASALRAGVERALEVKRNDIEGMVYGLNGDLNAAVAAHEKALAASELAFGRNGAGTWEAEQLLGTTYTKVGAFGKAAPHFVHALALREDSVGPDHPDVALVLSNLGVCYRHLHDPRARATFERALAIRERIYGPKSPMIVATLDNFAEYLQQEKDYPAALAMFDRGRQIAKIVPGTAHAIYHTLANDYAEALVAAGRLADAHHAFDELIALEQKSQSSMLAETLTSRAELALVEKKWPDAAAFAKQGLAGFEALGGKDNPKLWRPLSRLAAAEIGLGHREVARPLLERAIAIGEKAQVPDDDLAPAHEALAQVQGPAKSVP